METLNGGDERGRHIHIHIHAGAAPLGQRIHVSLFSVLPVSPLSVSVLLPPVSVLGLCLFAKLAHVLLHWVFYLLCYIQSAKIMNYFLSYFLGLQSADEICRCLRCLRSVISIAFRV
jgi:hypothetical protein